MTDTATVLSLIGYCDTKHEHEVRLITDGLRAFAYTTDLGDDTDAVTLHGSTITVLCPSTGQGRHTCGGVVEYRYTPEDAVPHDEAVALLNEYGKVIES